MPRNWDNVLHEGIRTSKMKQIQKAVHLGADVNCTGLDGNTPLASATKNGQIDTMKYLLRHNADVFKSDPKGMPPLYWAIKRGHLEAVKLLCARININKVDDKGYTPLVYAAQEGKTNIVEFLINNGADFVKSVSGANPLTEAIINGNLEVVKLLVDKGANINKFGPDGNTPLALAVKYRHSGVVKFLTMMEADFWKCGERSAVSWAVLNEDFDSLGLFLENGANEKMRNVLFEAVDCGNLNVAKFLIDEGAVIEDLVMNRAGQVGNKKILEFLEQYGRENSFETHPEEDFVLINIENGKARK